MRVRHLRGLWLRWRSAWTGSAASSGLDLAWYSAQLQCDGLTGWLP